MDKEIKEMLDNSFIAIEKSLKTDNIKVEALTLEIEAIKKQMLKTNQEPIMSNVEKKFKLFANKEDETKLYSMVHKANNAPVDFTISGTLVPETVAAMWDGVKDNSAFLKQILTYKAKKTSGDFKALYPEARKLVQVVNTTLLAGNNSLSAKGHAYACKPSVYAVDIPYQTIDDNADTGSFMADVDSLITKQFSNDISDLAMVGTHDDFAGSAFVKINKGFVQLFKDSVTAAVANYTAHVWDNGADADMLVSMDNLIRVLPGVYKSEGDMPEFFLSNNDYELYQAKLAASDNSAALLIYGNPNGYMGYKVNRTRYLADGVQFLTAPKNLCLVECLSGVRYSAVDNNRRSCVEITFNLDFDFVLLNDDAIAFGYNV